MRVFLSQNVYEAALDRIRRIFDEFETVIVNSSGGKDSTVVFNLCLQVAEEKGRLPLKVLFIDQEAEWQSVIDYMRIVMYDPRVEPIWLQIPIKLFNATSVIEPWLYCWEDGKDDQWVREKEPIAIKENTFGTDRFAELFARYLAVTYPDQPVAHIAGVRAEESPARMNGLTSYETYKGITWGKAEDKTKHHYVFYPLYDWSYTDVWAAIHKNGWPYCRIYDYMYQYGVPIQKMRVSNVHHETAVHSLFFLQEIEGKTWEKITQRISGINTAGQLNTNFYCPKELPWMFKDWWEYRDHLLDNLILDEAIREKMRAEFKAHDDRYLPEAQNDLVKTEIACILTNDYHGTKLSTFHASHGRLSKNRGKFRHTMPEAYGADNVIPVLSLNKPVTPAPEEFDR